MKKKKKGIEKTNPSSAGGGDGGRVKKTFVDVLFNERDSYFHNFFVFPPPNIVLSFTH